MVVKKAFDVAMSAANCLYALLTTTSVFNVMSRVNDVCVFVINYLLQRFHKQSKARWCSFVPAFQKLSKGGTEIDLHASIVLAFISGVELFDYVVDEEESVITWLRGSQMRDIASRWDKSNPWDTMTITGSGYWICS